MKSIMTWEKNVSSKTVKKGRDGDAETLKRRALSLVGVWEEGETE